MFGKNLIYSFVFLPIIGAFVSYLIGIFLEKKKTGTISVDGEGNPLGE